MPRLAARRPEREVLRGEIVDGEDPLAAADAAEIATYRWSTPITA